MARSLSTIYNEAVTYRNQRLELKNLENSSKFSVLNALTWTVSACIWSFETLLDTFKVDLALELDNRINGTPAYYANALLKWQKGDTLVPNDTYTQFSYATTDETKQLITKVSYSEVECEGYHDTKLLLKVAKTTTVGDVETIEPLSEDELRDARNYMSQIVFAGTHYQVVSRKGDEITPKVTVYYQSSTTASTVKEAIETSLKDYAAGIGFDGVVSVSAVLEAIYHTEGVTDVVINSDKTSTQGVYITQYDDDDTQLPEQKIDRNIHPNSGYITIGSLDEIIFVVEK